MSSRDYHAAEPCQLDCPERNALHHFLRLSLSVPGSDCDAIGSVALRSKCTIYRGKAVLQIPLVSREDVYRLRPSRDVTPMLIRSDRNHTCPGEIDIQFSLALLSFEALG